MAAEPELAPIFLRAHTKAKTKKKDSPDFDNGLSDRWARFALIIDCETTTDMHLDLTFLWWRFCELKDGRYIPQLEGVAYGDTLDANAIEVIRNFASSKQADVEKGCPHQIRIQSLKDFMRYEFWDAVVAGATIVCFNAPFDLSRLALKYGIARNKGTGWAMKLWNERRRQRFKPRLRIKPKDSRSAFISLAGGEPFNRVEYRGRFLDLSVLGWALRNIHMTLDGFLDSFGLEAKMPHEPTGLVTPEELAYGRRDVEQTLELLNAMKIEYDGFPIDLQPEKAMSAASITKAFLEKMQIIEPAKKYELPDAILGKCMQAYYGGRSEIRIRHTEVPVVVCDATSEYPSVAVLMKLCPLLTAAAMDVVDCTTEAQNLLNRLKPEELLTQSVWKELAFFASIKPNGDILSVRSLYSQAGTNIGLNPLTSTEPIWCAGPDLAAAKLFGTTPQVIEAFRLVPRGSQSGMKSVVIGSRKFNPEVDDFFQVIIEERKKLPEDHPHSLLLKIIANSLYGVFAELNKNEYGKNGAKKLEVFSGEHKFSQTTRVVERPGRWQFPPAAALITAGGRLVLAILEWLVTQQGGSYLLTDTDSMLIVASEKGGPVPCSCSDGKQTINALTWKQVEDICALLNGLNPYDRNSVGEMLKIEKCNRDQNGKQQQLYGLAVSAKRYVVYRRNGHDLEIIKPSEHGLGIVYLPDARERYIPMHCQDRKTSYARWVVEAWEYLLERHFRDVNDALVSRKLWFADLPAIMRIRVTTPNVMAVLRKHDRRAAKPYNFAQSPILVDSPPGCTLIAPSSKHPENWLSRAYIEIHEGKSLRLYDFHRGKQLRPQTLSGVIWRHFLHPEAKSLGPDGRECGFYTTGLLQRRPINAMLPFRFIGKEIERKAQEGEDISIIESSGPIRYEPRRTMNTRAADPAHILRAKRFGVRQLIRESGKEHAVQRYLAGKRVHPGTRTSIIKAVERLEREQRRQRLGE